MNTNGKTCKLLELALILITSAYAADSRPHASGFVIYWGRGEEADCPAEAVDWAAVEVYTTDFAFLALDRRAGNATCWGSRERGADCPAEAVDWAAVEVYSTGYAFLALDRRAGNATCWGDRFSGADCPAEAVDWAAVEVYSTDYAFLALDRRAGNATCWGARIWGGDCPAEAVDWAAVEVYSTTTEFLALDRERSAFINGTRVRWFAAVCGVMMCLYSALWAVDAAVAYRSDRDALEEAHRVPRQHGPPTSEPGAARARAPVATIWSAMKVGSFAAVLLAALVAYPHALSLVAPSLPTRWAATMSRYVEPYGGSCQVLDPKCGQFRCGFDSNRVIPVLPDPSCSRILMTDKADMTDARSCNAWCQEELGFNAWWPFSPYCALKAPRGISLALKACGMSATCSLAAAPFKSWLPERFYGCVPYVCGALYGIPGWVKLLIRLPLLRREHRAEVRSHFSRPDGTQIRGDGPYNKLQYEHLILFTGSTSDAQLASWLLLGQMAGTLAEPALDIASVVSYALKGQRYYALAVAATMAAVGDPFQMHQSAVQAEVLARQRLSEEGLQHRVREGGLEGAIGGAIPLFALFTLLPQGLDPETWALWLLSAGMSVGIALPSAAESLDLLWQSRRGRINLHDFYETERAKSSMPGTMKFGPSFALLSGVLAASLCQFMQHNIYRNVALLGAVVPSFVVAISRHFMRGVPPGTLVGVGTAAGLAAVAMALLGPAQEAPRKAWGAAALMVRRALGRFRGDVVLCIVVAIALALQMAKVHAAHLQRSRQACEHDTRDQEDRSPALLQSRRLLITER